MSAPTADRVTTVPAKTAEHWRVAMFTVINLFLSSHRTMSAHGGLNPVELLVYATVTIGNIQKLVRERLVPPHLAGTAILPREWVVPMSRNAISAATGLPRETVRRHVERMIQTGLLIEDPRGGVTGAVGSIETQNLPPLLDALLTEFARAAETLLRCGVIEVTPGRPSLGDRI